ncbi:unnamed protein product [Linum trigynum]|uniref:Reverse transcriptase domain-containing protein n=1 Tax=Linum trigynum TaxID=586398 RepID=A0AAV2FQB0_9ROSI
MVPQSLPHFKILAWNVCGAGGKTFLRTTKLLIRNHNPDFLILIEPQISGTRADQICEKLGFPEVIRVEANGRKGGIWVAWRPDDFTVQLIDASPQHITVKVSNDQLQDWLLTGVYGSPQYSHHRSLWEHLILTSRRHSLPWVITGDFNAYRSPDEKLGPINQASLRRCQQFSSWINEANLIDLGFSGPQYTWSRGDSVRSHKASRIDRSFCNTSWNVVFPDSSVLHLPKLHSDHCPILTSSTSRASLSGNNKLFQFEAAWFMNNQFADFFAGSWDCDAPLQQALKDLVPKLMDWNKSVFGIINHRKKRLLARIQGVQERLACSFAPSLIKLQAKLERELDILLEQEEVIWFQRAKEKWVKLGEQNTSYFHQQASRRRRRNKIQALKDAQGNWVDDPGKLRAMVLDFFAALCTEEDHHYEDRMPKFWFPRITNADMLSLLRPFSISDIHKAVFEMKPLSAPGPDGFQAIFYQKFWPTVGKSLAKMAIDFFDTGTVPEEVMDSTMVLIPKIDHPEVLAQLRPISLNNVCLKAITKAIVNRLKPVMSKIIASTQSSFISGRQTNDNILILQEVLHSLRRKQGKKGGLVIKIDLEKAYDRLRWEFIQDSLKEVGLPSSWISRIMFCVQHNRIQINWNGQLTDAFTPTRGFRQGDPLSPYLFVICMERLSHRIEQAIAEKTWKPISLSTNGPKLSHLFFADDLVLFAEAEGSQIETIRQCLDDFCHSSGQRINLLKSAMYVSPNVHWDKAQRLSSRAGIPLTADLGKYLGLHTINGRITKNRYTELILRIQNKLASWKTK